MSNLLRVSVCTIDKTWIDNQATSLGQNEPVNDGVDGVAAAITRLSFDGHRLAGDDRVADLREAVRLAVASGAIGGNTVLLISGEEDLSGDQFDLVNRRAIVVKNLLLGLGLNGVNVCADRCGDVL